MVRKIYTLIAFLVPFSFISAELKVKSSITFVIDDTISMYEEIRQVKERTNDIFEAVLSSNASKIDEFIIVTFNDPDAKLLVKTNRGGSGDFEKVLGRIQPRGGGDCPENAMEGIKLALEKSKPNSFLYAFTDASAKDYEKYENVKSLALEKSIQINFLLTGECKNEKNEELHKVYDRLAAATSGQVFHIGKLEIDKIIKYVLANLRSTRTILLRKTYGYRCDRYKFAVDSKVWDILIALSATKKLDYDDLIVLDPVGNKASISSLIHTEKTTIFTLQGKPGEYSIDIRNCADITVVVSAATSVSFRHGFSTATPSSLHETSTKPLLGKKSYLAIELDNDERDVTLKTLEIWDMDDKLVQQLPLKLADKENQFYITDLFTPPEKAYKIAISGYTKLGEKITRFSQTSTEYHRPENVAVEYGESIVLNFKVDAIPPGTIVWYRDNKEIMNNEDMAITMSFDGSSLNIKSAKPYLEGEYYVTASNGHDREKYEFKITVTMEHKPTAVKILGAKKIISEYNQTLSLKCKVGGFPKPSMTWEDEVHKVLPSKVDEITPYEYINTLHIQATKSATYICKAKNILNEDSVSVEVITNKKKIFNVLEYPREVPRIDKNVNIYTPLRNSSVDIKCRVIQGKPEPKVSWLFDHESLGKFRNLKETAETIHIKHVTENDVGTYRCDVSNEVGSDHHEMQLKMEYPPEVSLNPSRSLESEKDKQVKLDCKVDGSPTPNVRWLVDEVEIRSGPKYKIFRNHTLSFTGAIRDSGIYRCEASNSLDTNHDKVRVFIYDPPRIEKPKQSVFDAKLKSSLVLPCHATGYPKPKVKWIYHPFGRAPSTNKTKSDKDNNVILDNIQPEHEGFYSCVAHNSAGTDSFTYTVNVPVPATINFSSGTKKIQLVEGDLYFNLSCQATGSPKPIITWTINGTKVGSGGGIEILSDGTLTGRNVTMRNSGTYSCKAENKHGEKSIEYEVDVHEFPPILINPRVLLITEGETYDIFCDLKLEEGCLARWFKDGKFIKTGGILTLVNVAKADAGDYTCRFSKLEGSSFSFHNRVVVGTKPKFIANLANPVRIQYKAGARAHLDCRATGDPPPTTKWWYDANRINESNEYVDTPQYTFIMNDNKIGQYMCSVSNKFATIKRNFHINDEECLMDLKKDFTARQPLLLEYSLRTRRRPILNITGGSIRMPKRKKFRFFCPNSFISYNNHNYGNNLGTYCMGDSMFKLGGKDVKASEITCDKPIIPSEIIKNDPNKCLGSNTKLHNIGFDVDRSFVNVFDVCFNETTKMPIFVRYGMHRSIANIIPEHVAEYTRGTSTSFQFEEIYDCKNQLDAISSFTGKSLKSVEDEKCCFKRRQLVNPKDVLPGISQVATYHYINVVPQWSTCGSENWDEVEERVRQYAFSLEKRISIWTGIASVVKNVTSITLKDKLNQELQVPQFIWKVVENELAIIHINVPGLTSPQASPYILCLDICETKDWMKNPQWHDVDKGYIYCCTVKEFERAFDYQDVFYLDKT